MKSRMVFLFLSLGIILCGCEKDKSNNMLGNRIFLDQEPIVDYALKNCVYSENGNWAGYRCTPGVEKTCKKSISCKPQKDDDGNKVPLEAANPVLAEWGFTDDEIIQWGEGYDIFNEITSDFILQKYQYFLTMWESGITYHPDTLIMLMEN